MKNFSSKILKNFRTPVQTRRLNGALNRVPMNLYQRIWKILERTAGGIVIAGHHLPQVLKNQFFE